MNAGTARLTRFDVPTEWRWPGPPTVNGVVFNGCVSNQRWGTQLAHAHRHGVPGAEPWGFMCFKTRDILTLHGWPTNVAIHELAHLITGEDHTQRWAEEMRRWGAEPEAAYFVVPPGTRFIRMAQARTAAGR